VKVHGQKIEFRIKKDNKSISMRTGKISWRALSDCDIFQNNILLRYRVQPW
jgi:hypothetical protein